MNCLTSKSKPISQFLFSNKPSKIFCIYFFSSSSLSQPSSTPSIPRNYPNHSGLRRHDVDSRNVSVSVWWDIENCGVPTGVNVFKISQNIFSAVRVNGIKGPVRITAFGDIFCLSRANQEALSSTGVDLVHIPHGGKNSADRSLLVDLMYWVSQNPPPAHVFLISGDRDFAGILHKLRMNNYNILLAGREGKHTPPVLCSAASIMWHWCELAKGENLNGRQFGSYNSWYGHYRGPFEDPYETSEHNTSVENEKTCNPDLSLDSKRHPVPLTVLRQIRRIVNAYPEGLTFNEFRTALVKNKVPIDKDIYGYKKLPRFLMSIPHVVKVESLLDGQYFLRPVPRKIRECVGPEEVEGTKKVNEQTPTITRMVDDESQVPVSPRVNNEHKKEDSTKKETIVTSKNEGLDVPQIDNQRDDNQVNSTKVISEKEVLNFEVVENPKPSEKEQNSENKVGFFFEQSLFSHSRPGLFTRVIDWFKSWRNSSVKTPIEQQQSSEESGFTEEKKDVDNDLHTRKHELFSKDTFWNALQSFLRTRRGADIVSSSTSRDDLAIRLQKEGPLVLRPLKERDLHYLVDSLVLKKLISEFPTQTPRFKTVHSPIVSSPERQPQNIQSQSTNRLGSIFKGSSPQENPQPRVTPSVYKKPFEKSRSEVLADCQKLLDDLLVQYPDGFNLGIFKRCFIDEFGYPLDHQKLGYPKLVSLLHIMPGVRVESAYVYSDKVVFSPSIESVGVTEKPSGSCLGSDSDGPQKNEDGESPWEELGPVAEQERKISNPSNGNYTYESSESQDDEFSELEENATSSPGQVKEDDQIKSNSNNEDSSLLQILDHWYAKDSQYKGTQNEGFKNSCNEDSKSTQSSNSSVKSEVGFERKQRPQKSYKFVADHVEEKDKLVDGIFCSLKKSGESKMQG